MRLPGPPVCDVDPGLLSLLAELRAHKKQAAEELGQWSEKREPAGDGTAAPTSLTVTFVRPGDALSHAEVVRWA